MPEKRQKEQIIRERVHDWLMPRPFDWVSTTLYLGILVISYVKLSIRGVQSSTIVVTVCISIGIVALLLLERGEYYWHQQNSGKRMALVIFLVRLLLIGGVIQLERFYFLPLNYAAILYIIPPYAGTISFGYRAGVCIALLAGVAYLTQEMLTSLGWYTNIGSLWTATLFCIALVFVLAMARVVSQEKANRMRMEVLLAEVERAHHQVTVYAEQVAELAAVKERNRIARDIHDGVGHSLIAISVQLEKALVYYADSPQEALEAVRVAKQAAKEAIGEIRSSVRALRQQPEIFSLAQSIAILIQQISTGRFLINYRVEGDETAFGEDVRMTLYRVVQEGLTNVRKHAEAERVEMVLDFRELEVYLSIRDHGLGFELQRLQPGDRYGLQSMRERIALVAGELYVESAPGQGTALIVRIPKKDRCSNGS